MARHRRWLIGVFTAVTATHSSSWAAEQGAQTRAADDEKKLEEVKEMFKSPYTEEDYYRTDRLLVTATGSQLPIYKAPAVASIITAEDIENMGAVSLDDVLETVPGMHVGPSVDSGYRTNYHIRGIYTGLNQQVLLLINGIPINTVYSGTRQPTLRVPTANISRVEIIRGPGSAVHGADAFAGTINVITKDVHEVQNVRTGIRGGSFETYEAWFQVGGSGGGWETALSLEYGQSKGDRERIITSDQQTILDSVFGTSASLAPGVMDTHFKYLEANLALRKGNWHLRQRYWTDMRQGPMWLGVTDALARSNLADVDSYLADLRYANAKLAPDWELSAGLSYLRQRADYRLVLFPPGAVVLIGEDGNLFTGTHVVIFPDGVIGGPGRTEHTVVGEISTIFTGIRDHRLRFGLGAKHMVLEARSLANFGPGILDGTETAVGGTLTDTTGTPVVYIPDGSRQIGFVFAQDEWSIAHDWDLTAGVRYDHYSDFGGTLNPRAALVWETRYDLTTKLLYGRAFRPPSFQELYSQNNPANKGNLNLNPETIQTFELAFDYQPTTNLRAILNLYWYEASDLIEQVPDAAGTGKTTQNAREQKGYGFELEMDWELTDNFRLRANCAWLSSEDEKTKKPVANTPHVQFFVNPHVAWSPDWSFDGHFKWIGGRKRADGDTRDEIDDYVLVGLTLRRRNIWEHWDLSVAASNLFNADAREPTNATVPDDYPMPGRCFLAELKYHY